MPDSRRPVPVAPADPSAPPGCRVLGWSHDHDPQIERIEKLVGFDPPWDRDDLDLRRQAGMVGQVVARFGRVVAYIIANVEGPARLHGKPVHPRLIFVDRMATDPGHQREGVGTFLMRGVKAQATLAGYPIRLSVRMHNFGALEFYKGNGFRPIRWPAHTPNAGRYDADGFYRDGEPALLLEWAADNQDCQGR